MSVLRGQTPDRIPVFANLDFWYRARRALGDWPSGLAGKSLDEIQLDLGMGLTKGASVARRSYRPPVRYQMRREGADEIETWTTPRGTLRRVRRHRPDHAQIGVVPHLVEYPIKTTDDYRTFIEVVEHLDFEADPGFRRYRSTDAALGSDGVVTVGLSKSPAHDMMMKWVGYTNAYYHLADAPDLFEAAAQAANRAYRPLWEILADSPCRVIMHGGNYSTHITPPSIFARFFLPYFQAFNERMHQAGKFVVCHTDGDMRGLLELFLEAGFDGTNCFACDPLVSCTLEEAASAWGDRIVIWGGVPSILLEASADEGAFRAHLQKLLDIARRGVPVIAGISDHGMPSSLYARIVEMADFFQERGQYPLSQL
jgi:hypothetical protein